MLCFDKLAGEHNNKKLKKIRFVGVYPEGQYFICILLLTRVSKAEI